VSEDPGSYELQSVIEKAESMDQVRFLNFASFREHVADFDIFQPIHELELILQELRSTTSSPHFSPKLSTSPSQTSFLSPDSRSSSSITQSGSSSGSSTAGSSGGTLLRFLGKRSNSQSGPSKESSSSSSNLSVQPPSPSHNGGQPVPSPRSSSFTSPRKPSFSSQIPPSPSYLVDSSASTPTGSTNNDDFFDAVSSPPNALLLQRFASVLDTLRSSHSSLLDSLQNLPVPDATTPGVEFNPAFSFGAPLSPNSTFSPPPSQYASRNAQGFYPTHRGTPSRASSRASFSSFFSADEGESWDDASSMVEGEFVLDDEEEEAEDKSDEGKGEMEDELDEDDDEGKPDPNERHRPRASDVRRKSTIAEEEEEEGEFDQGEETDEEAMQEEEKKGGRKRSQTTTSTTNYDQKVDRRRALPSESGPEEGLLGLAKQVIGKVRIARFLSLYCPADKILRFLQDLSNISLPVTTNEPISALQRIAEELEYSELLDRAVAADDPMERLTLVAVFAISTYGGNKYRVTRKPFNPLLGETFEWIRPDKGRSGRGRTSLAQ